jgi:hypothetical protein
MARLSTMSSLLASPLILLSIGASLALGQKTVDPLHGEYVLGNSAEMMLVRCSSNLDAMYSTLFDFKPGFDSISAPAPESIPGVGYPDVAMADVDGDGKEESGTIWFNMYGDVVLTINAFTNGSVGFSRRTDTPLGEPKANPQIPMRIVRGNFDSTGCDQFAVAYWTLSEKVRILIVRVDSTTLTPTIVGDIADMSLPASLGADARFDLTVGDFDRDGLDELFVVKLNARESTASSFPYLVYFTITHLYACVYDVDKVSLQPVLRGSKTFDEVGTFGLTSGTDLRTGGLVATCGDYNGDGLKEPVVCWSNGFVFGGPTPVGELRAKHLAISTDLTSVTDGVTAAFQCDAYSPGQTEGTTTWGNWPVGAVSGDLNGDGKDELVTGGLRNLHVYQANASGQLTLFAARALPAIDAMTIPRPGQRFLAIGDVDASVNTRRWYPEIVVTMADWFILTGSGLAWEVLGATVDTTTGAMTSIIQKASGTMYYHNGGLLSQSYSVARWALALGDVNGDAVRVRNPRRLLRENVMQPIVILNAPPAHFDKLADSVYDVCNNFQGAEGTFSATYEKSTSQTVQFSTEVNADWGVSATVSGGGSFLGIGAEAHFTASYGEGFSKSSESGQTLAVTETQSTTRDDRICVTNADYEYWEYPLYQGGEFAGDVLVVIPRLHSPPFTWISAKDERAKWYTPRHEVGNILSYMSEGGVGADGDVGSLLHLFTSSQVDAQATTGWEVDFSQFMSNSETKSNTIGFEAGASVSGWGVEVSTEGHYNREQLSTHSSTATSGIKVTLNVGGVNRALGDDRYTIGPAVYWAKNGALVVDYTVEPNTSAGTTPTWWDVHYGQAPDPAFNLPWRLDVEKGQPTDDPAQKWLTKSIRVSPSVVKPGDKAVITAKIANYSLKPLTHSVPVRFFLGHPDSGGVPIVGDGNVTELLTGTLVARAYQPLQMTWTVPQLATGIQRLYGVIDPDDSVSEIHEDNNLGFTEIAGFNPTLGVEEKPNSGVPSEFALFQNYPNPFNPSTVIRFSLPVRGHAVLKVYDLLGREVATLVDGVFEAGTHNRWFDGRHLASGMYICSLRAGTYSHSVKMMMVK